MCVVSMVVWCAGVYSCAVSMRLCLCVVSLYVCALCHVLVVYVSVLEWLGWSVLCCRWWLCPCCWFAYVSMPSYLCACLIVSGYYVDVCAWCDYACVVGPLVVEGQGFYNLKIKMKNEMKNICGSS